MARTDAENLAPQKCGYVPGSFYIEAVDETFWTGVPCIWIVAGNLAHHDARYHLRNYRAMHQLVDFNVYQEGV